MSTPKLTPQQERVMDYLKTGSTLTNVVALAALKIGSLSKRIAELRRMGYPITGRWGVDTITQNRYRLYDLEQPKVDTEVGRIPTTPFPTA
jgi:hypothetical protein